MEIKYPNTTVVINDPDGRFKSDDEISVKLKYDSQQNAFLVTVPEMAKKETKPKPQPTSVYEGTQEAVKGTIKVNGNLKVGVDIAPKKAREISLTTLKVELAEAMDAVWNKTVGN